MWVMRVRRNTKPTHFPMGQKNLACDRPVFYADWISRSGQVLPPLELKKNGKHHIYFDTFIIEIILNFEEISVSIILASMCNNSIICGGLLGNFALVEVKGRPRKLNLGLGGGFPLWKGLKGGRSKCKKKLINFNNWQGVFLKILSFFKVWVGGPRPLYLGPPLVKVHDIHWCWHRF